MEEEKMVAQYTWGEILKVSYQVMNYQLFELDGHGVSLGKLLSGIFMLAASYIISRRAAREVDRRVLGRMTIDDHLRYTLRRFIFYFFLCLMTLFTLHTLNVPVTIFTVLGGALAVGIGFGSQNLVNNFISGILVMMERPIRVGDFVDCDGVSGQIEQIGIRSTIMRTGLNAVTILPNTTFIEKVLTNWTMSEVIVSSVRVGVAYGTDVRRFSDLAMAVVRETERVVKEPAPSIVFVDFGDNALVFDLIYYIQAANFPSRRAIESAIRFRLNDLFTEHGIEIPFPQRDLHVKLSEMSHALAAERPNGRPIA
jgi:small-conductance mechanosensitive channel